MYLTQDEFCVLAQLSARMLSKTRFSVPPFGIDVFEGPLAGLVLGEVEFDSASAAGRLEAGTEVSADNRFTAGRLVGASRHDIQAWLLEYVSVHREPPPAERAVRARPAGSRCLEYVFNRELHDSGSHVGLNLPERTAD